MPQTTIRNFTVTDESHPLFVPTSRPFPEAEIPEAVYDDEPELVRLWKDAWRIGWSHVYESEAMPYSPYMGEGCAVNRVWIWDSCFMALWTGYAPDLYPAANTLDNFYDILGGGEAGIRIHHVDNPPLFGWAELELFRRTGDLKRVKNVISSGILQKHWHWLEEAARPGDFVPAGQCPIQWRKMACGYLWGGIQSGMDNTPRGGGNYQSILWVDALAQQGGFARDIADLCDLAGEAGEAAEYRRYYEEKKALISHYFDPQDRCFYDINVTPDFVWNHDFFRVLTPASFWPVFAGMATEEQVRGMVNALCDPERLGGPVSCPSVSRSDPAFDPAGEYWRGGVWLPVFYMTMKALERSGETALARKLSLQLLRWMKQCYDEVTPHTIWECYSPTVPRPSTNKVGGFSRPEFCGWSALGPISLLLENVIGIRIQSAAERRVWWELPEKCPRRGVRQLRMGHDRITLLADSDSIMTESALGFRLETPGAAFQCPSGKFCIDRRTGQGRPMEC